MKGSCNTLELLEEPAAGAVLWKGLVVRLVVVGTVLATHTVQNEPFCCISRFLPVVDAQVGLMYLQRDPTYLRPTSVAFQRCLVRW